MASLIIAIVGACVWVILSAAVGNFADKRGHSGTLWYLFSLFCSPIIGFALIAALPSAETLGRPTPLHQCPYCSAALPTEPEICPVCHRELNRKANEKIAA